MKYTPVDQVNRITRLQNEVVEHYSKICDCLREADELANELKREAGERFVISDQPYRLQHKAIGYGMVGNRNWLERDRGVKVIQ